MMTKEVATQSDLLLYKRIVEFLQTSGVTVCVENGKLLNVVDWAKEELKRRGEIR